MEPFGSTRDALSVSGSEATHTYVGNCGVRSIISTPERKKNEYANPRRKVVHFFLSKRTEKKKNINIQAFCSSSNFFSFFFTPRSL